MIDDGAKDAIKRALADPRAMVRLLNLDTRGANRHEERQAGGGVKVCCPWHSEKHPSCSLTRGADGTLRAYCFTCDGGGDVFDLLAAVRGLERDTHFRELLTEAAQLAGVDLGAEEQPRAPRLQLPAPPPFAPMAPEPIGLHDRAFGALVEPLLNLGRLDGGPISADVCAYLEGRRMLDVAQAEGWAALPPAGSEAARSWCCMLRDVAGDIAAALDVDSATVLAEVDVIVQRDRFGDRFAHPEHRLVIPFRAPCGTLYTWQRRRLDAGDPKYVFPHSRDRRWLPCEPCQKRTPHEETMPGRWTCTDCPGGKTGPDARAGRGRAARWPYGVERLAAAPADAPIVYTEGAIDAAAVRTIDAAAGRARVVLGVPGTQAWSKGAGFFATYAAGRVAFVATDADAPNKQGKRPGEDAAKDWGADLWRANARDVQRERPVAAKDWCEALERARGGARG